MNKFESDFPGNAGVVPTAAAIPSSTASAPHDPGASAHPKKVYTSPHLVEYGDVRKLTETVGNGGVNDGLHFKTA